MSHTPLSNEEFYKLFGIEIVSDPSLDWNVLEFRDTRFDNLPYAGSERNNTYKYPTPVTSGRPKDLRSVNKKDIGVGARVCANIHRRTFGYDRNLRPMNELLLLRYLRRLSDIDRNTVKRHLERFRDYSPLYQQFVTDWDDLIRLADKRMLFTQGIRNRVSNRIVTTLWDVVDISIPIRLSKDVNNKNVWKCRILFNAARVEYFIDVREYSQATNKYGQLEYSPTKNGIVVPVQSWYTLLQECGRLIGKWWHQLSKDKKDK